MSVSLCCDSCVCEKFYAVKSVSLKMGYVMVLYFVDVSFTVYVTFSARTVIVNSYVPHTAANECRYCGGA